MNRRETQDPEEEAPRLIDWLREMYSSIRLFSDLLIGLPLYILNKLGIDLIPNLFAQNCRLFSICMCGAFLAITSSVGIGLGVGLGVGLNCGETIYIYKNISSP